MASARSRIIRTVAIAVGISSPFLAALGFVFGAFTPLEAMGANHDIDVLERHLYLHESRAAIEAQFGHGIPRPERQDRFGPQSERLGQYAYGAGGAICIGYWRGVAVHYDDDDRAVYWERYEFADGC